MNTTVQALLDLYVQLGGELTNTYSGIANGVQVGEYTTIPDCLEAIKALIESGATKELPQTTASDLGKVVAVAEDGGYELSETFNPLEVEIVYDYPGMFLDPAGYEVTGTINEPLSQIVEAIASKRIVKVTLIANDDSMTITGVASSSVFLDDVLHTVTMQFNDGYINIRADEQNENQVKLTYVADTRPLYVNINLPQNFSELDGTNNTYTCTTDKFYYFDVLKSFTGVDANGNKGQIRPVYFRFRYLDPSDNETIVYDFITEPSYHAILGVWECVLDNALCSYLKCANGTVVFDNQNNQVTIS